MHALTPADITVVVLNWNGKDDSLRCLESLEAHGEGCTVLFVDNGSTDGSADAVRSRFPDVEVLENGVNLGFAAGNNRGIERALSTGATIVGVLNNDTTVTKSFLGPLVSAIERDPSAFVSPVIRYLDDPTRIWFGAAEIEPNTGIFVHRPLEEATPGLVAETPMVTGCALFAHRSVWERVGLFDERYFLIFEDADWSARANALGFHGQVVHDSCIHHAVSATIDARAASAADYYYARNGLRFIRDHADHPLVASISFLKNVGRDSLRPLRVSVTPTNLAVPTLQARGAFDALTSRSGPMSPTRLSRWGERTRAPTEPQPDDSTETGRSKHPTSPPRSPSTCRSTTPSPRTTSGGAPVSPSGRTRPRPASASPATTSPTSLRTSASTTSGSPRPGRPGRAGSRSRHRGVRLLALLVRRPAHPRAPLHRGARRR